MIECLIFIFTQVYDTNTSRKEIILDVDLVFASDLEIVFKIKGE